jgi:hypothetical protein
MLYTSFWAFPGGLILSADVSKHTVSSTFIGGVDTRPMKVEQTECFDTSTHKIQTQGNHPTKRLQHLLIFCNWKGEKKIVQR